MEAEHDRKRDHRRLQHQVGTPLLWSHTDSMTSGFDPLAIKRTFFGWIGAMKMKCSCLQCGL
eukprot:751459-Hanusia_phi.AAC.1